MTNLGKVLGQFIRRQQTEKELQLIGQLLSMRYQSYLVIDKNFIIEKIADGAEKFSDYPDLILNGADVRHGFPALSGLESSLMDLIEGKADNFELSNVPRDNDRDSSISIYIVANRQDDGPHDRLFIFFEEVSEEQVLKKALLQKEKEAFLLLEQLSKTNKTMQSELDGASNYVRSLLPAPAQVESVNVDQAFLPSIQLGGDVFDYYWLDRDHFVFYLLDVAGHGVKSALLSVSVLNVLRSQSLNNTDFYEPGSVLSGLNRVFQMNDRGEDYFTIGMESSTVK
ncbi:MAG: SpoIIE family protein phosphatase [Synechococcaceae cyanobacterium RL_1_2]|nr:SpoIIE family protein phosphatase [Synechococcaceae cyanobacterium RL_1_2]